MLKSPTGILWGTEMQAQIEEAFRVHETIHHLSEAAQMCAASMRGFASQITHLYADTRALQALIQRFHFDSNSR